MKPTKRLTNDNYKKKGPSYQESLSNEEIMKKLENYKQIVNINTVGLGTHIRYFLVDKKTQEKKFRMGGFLSKVDLEKGYIILRNGTSSWSVQLNNSLLFQKMDTHEFKEEIVDEAKNRYKKKIAKLEKELEKVKEERDNLKQAIKDIKKKYKK